MSDESAATEAGAAEAATGEEASAPKPSRMLPQERQWGTLIAAAALVGFVAVNTPWNGGSHASLGAFGVLLALLLGATAWWGNRIAGAFASMLVAFGPWGGAAVVGAAPMAYALLLGFRTSRAANGAATERARGRREARLAAKAARRAGTAGDSTPRSAGRGPSSRGRSRAAASGRSTSRTPAVDSRRVTPKNTPPRGGGRRLKSKKR